MEGQIRRDIYPGRDRLIVHGTEGNLSGYPIYFTDLGLEQLAQNVRGFDFGGVVDVKVEVYSCEWKRDEPMDVAFREIIGHEVSRKYGVSSNIERKHFTTTQKISSHVANKKSADTLVNAVELYVKITRAKEFELLKGNARRNLRRGLVKLL